MKFKTAVTVISIPILLYAAAAAVLRHALAPLCGNVALAEFPSPSRSLKASVWVRDCGATTDFSTQVSILDADGPSDSDSANVLVVDGDHGRAPVGSRGGPEVRVRWESDTVLVVAYHRSARVFRSAPKVGHVAITYEKFD